MIESTLRSFDSAVRVDGGWECLRGEIVGGGETGLTGGGVADLMGEAAGNGGSSAHA
jgi:hypothetical protein